MEDIAPKLLEEIQSDFQREFEKNRKINEIYKRVEDGIATYTDANEFAIETGEILSETLKKHISSDALPDGRMYYNIAQRILQPTMKNNYDLTADVSMKVQETINLINGIGIKAIKPELNQDRIDGIIDIVSGKEYFDDVAYMFGEAIVNFTQSVVDDTVKENVDFHYKAGLSPKIRRTSTGKCCDWCDKIAGVYEYSKVSDTGNDIFRRHKHCKCIVEYEPGNGKRQNVHTKKWINSSESDIIKKRKTDRLKPDSDRVVENIKEEISKQNISNIVKRQEIHRKGTSLYRDRENILKSKGQYGPSYVTISDNEILELVHEYSGTGIVKYNRNGAWNHQETIVTNNKIIGVVVDNRNGNSAETSVFKIHYGNDGIHIVPDYPSKKR